MNIFTFKRAGDAQMSRYYEFLWVSYNLNNV